MEYRIKHLVRGALEFQKSEQEVKKQLENLKEFY